MSVGPGFSADHVDGDHVTRLRQQLAERGVRLGIIFGNNRRRLDGGPRLGFINNFGV